MTQEERRESATQENPASKLRMYMREQRELLKFSWAVKKKKVCVCVCVEVRVCGVCGGTGVGDDSRCMPVGDILFVQKNVMNYCRKLCRLKSVYESK